MPADPFARVRSALIGDDVLVDGPFGPRRLVYADTTATGRSLAFVEDHIRERVLPLYGNTRAEASATGLHTTALREDARRIIHRAVGGGEDDVVRFCGAGSTAAITRFIHVLDLQPRERPVVFIGPSEHHSNELPWRESIADLVTIRASAAGGLDLGHLEDELRRHRARPLKIGSFAAASNVTGILTDVDAAAALLRSHGALSCWDYATAGLYLPIRMAGKDAVFLSLHKFPGGPGTPASRRRAAAAAQPRAVRARRRHGALRLLHHNFVVALLSDLFGIQARGGCFCAGPYLHRLYDVDEDWSAGAIRPARERAPHGRRRSPAPSATAADARPGAPAAVTAPPAPSPIRRSPGTSARGSGSQ